MVQGLLFALPGNTILDQTSLTLELSMEHSPGYWPVQDIPFRPGR